MHHKHFRIHTHNGDWVLDQPKYPPNKEKPMYNGHRADFHRVIYEYAMSLGIPIQLGRRVASYHEDDIEGKAWVVTDEGEIFKGDLVVGADGVRSKARKLVLGYDDKPKSSGYAVYRAWFDAEAAGITTDPLTREFVANGDTHTGCKLPHPIANPTHPSLLPLFNFFYPLRHSRIRTRSFRCGVSVRNFPICPG